MKVTYLEHSGFAVEYQEYVLIFDWYRGELPEFAPGKEIYVFASHAHFDHFNKKMFEWEKAHPGIQYILSADITEKPGSERIQSVEENREYRVGGLKVKTLHSTDEGVAFLVYMEDKVIYHAGDLNWWHWEEESDAYNRQMRKDYQREIQKLKDVFIDLAFVPLDPRQEEQYILGLDYFMRHTHTKCVFPMHMWGRYEVCDRLMKNPLSEPYRDRVMHVEEPGQVFEI